MGAYREQLLRETYGRGGSQLYGQAASQEEMPLSGRVSFFKIRLSISLLLFVLFAWLWMSGERIYNVSAEEIISAVTDEEMYIELSELWLYE